MDRLLYIFLKMFNYGFMKSNVYAIIDEFVKSKTHHVLGFKI